MTTTRDHKVSFKTRQDIAEIAMSWWRLAEKSSHSFNVCSFVVDQLAPRFTRKGNLRIEFFDQSPTDEPAWVEFDPLVIHVARNVWDLANRGDSHARHIVAHEIGHVVLHDKRAVAFSDEEAARLKFVQNEESAEWQANVFAEHFLVPDHVASRLNDADLIAGLCVVTDAIAERRLHHVRNLRYLPSQNLGGILCTRCGTLGVFNVGAIERCDACGSASRLP